MAPQCSELMNRYDRNRIISYDAKEWEKKAMGRHLIEERRLILTEEDGEQIQPVLASIEPHRWIKFVQNPGPVVSILVREFHTNMDSITNTSSVRGHTIFFASCVSNRLYETPDLDDIHLYALLCDPTWDDIGPNLCPVRIEWIIGTHGQRDWFTTININLAVRCGCYF
ncbi:hypothetical protein P3S67_005038 [Capsicum chacoense]